MLVGIFSDTHDQLEAAQEGLELFKEQGVELAIHAGDWTKPEHVVALGRRAQADGLTLVGVLGNNDKEIQAALEEGEDAFDGVMIATEEVLELKLNGQVIAVYHGQKSTVLEAMVDVGKYQVVVTGHTHRPQIRKLETTKVINPGAVSTRLPSPKDYLPSVMILDTESNEVDWYLWKKSRWQKQTDLDRITKNGALQD